jgi:RNA polymerase sigma factor (sigma-70 family)
VTDADLVHAANSGSDAAFSRIVERHQGAVRNFLRRMLAGGWAEADDVAQDVFIVAWREIGRLEDPAGLRAWLLGIAWRRAQDGTRAAFRRAVRDGAWSQSRDASCGGSAEDRIALAQAMGRLPPLVRACVALCVADGWSHAEAAQALDLPIGTVKSHVSRGRARLLSMLGGGDDA